MPALHIQSAGTVEQPGLQRSTQRIIHVVTAQHEVIADCQAVEAQTRYTFSDADQCEIRCAAAHIAHEDDLTIAHTLLPVDFMARQPGVEGSQRFLQQHSLRHASVSGRLQGELTRHLVEGRWHSQNDLLRLKTV